MILHPIGRDPPLFYVDLTSSYSNLTDDSLTLVTMDVGTNYSPLLVPYEEPPPTPSAKQRTRAFTDELNERERKRRWRR